MATQSPARGKHHQGVRPNHGNMDRKKHDYRLMTTQGNCSAWSMHQSVQQGCIKHAVHHVDNAFTPWQEIHEITVSFSCDPPRPPPGSTASNECRCCTTSRGNGRLLAYSHHYTRQTFRQQPTYELGDDAKRTGSAALSTPWSRKFIVLATSD